MSIIRLSGNKELPTSITCALCSRHIEAKEATFGPRCANGEPTFICNGHFWDGPRLINMLADFTVEERGKYLLEYGTNIMGIDGVDSDAWSLY